MLRSLRTDAVLHVLVLAKLAQDHDSGRGQFETLENVPVGSVVCTSAANAPIDSMHVDRESTGNVSTGAELTVGAWNYFLVFPAEVHGSA